MGIGRLRALSKSQRHRCLRVQPTRRMRCLGRTVCMARILQLEFTLRKDTFATVRTTTRRSTMTCEHHPASSTASVLPNPLPDLSAMDVIFIEGFVGDTVIGIHETELHRAQI